METTPTVMGRRGACDIEGLTFTTGGDAEWFAQTAESNYGGDAAQSGDIADDEEVWMQTTVEGPGTLSFDYRLSCEPNDGLVFYIDGQYKMTRNGNASWTTSGPWTIYGSGPHTLKWLYSKDSTGSSGSDCAWVDHIQWSGDMPDPNGGQEIAYTYDPAGRRIEKQVDGATQVKYVYDGDNCIAEYDGSNNLLRKYIHGPAIDEPICMIEVADANAVSCYHFDGLGSVIALSNGAGNTVQLYEYSVYGQVAASDPNHPNRFMFTGREFDADTGLYYYRARYYDAEIGRFLQTDPVGYANGVNWHRYCGNNPVTRVDPLGLYNVYTPELWPTKTYNAEGMVRTRPQEVDVAFFDGSDTGAPILDDQGNQIGHTANGAAFREAADDFIVDGKNTKRYCMMFDIGNEGDKVEGTYHYIHKILSGLKMQGYTVKNVYFYDHGGLDENGNVTTEMGQSGAWGETEWGGLASYMGDRGYTLPEGCTIHLMQCNAGSNNQSLLKSIADDFGCAARGTDGVNSFLTPPGWDNTKPYVYDPTYEPFGPDLVPCGTVWEAKPGQEPTVVPPPVKPWP